MKLFWLQLKNELIKLFARKRTHVGFAGFIAGEFLILFLWQLPPAKRGFRELLFKYGASFDDYYKGLTIAVLMVIFTFLLLGGLYLALVSGDIVAKEVEDGTMRMILSRPISRLRLLGIKWMASSIYTFTLIFFIGITSLIMASLFCGGLGKLVIAPPPPNTFWIQFYDTGSGLWHYARAVLFLAMVMHVVSAMAFMFSSLNMKPATATIATLTILFLDVVLRQIPFFKDFEKFFITYNTSTWIMTFQNPFPWQRVIRSLLYLASLIVIFLSIGAFSFCRRDFKS